VHEYSIVQALLSTVEAEVRARGATQVHRLSVRLGELSGVEPALLASAYETFRERTSCASAPLDVVSVPALWACPRCEGEIPRGERLRCPRCLEPARLKQGDDIILERIEMEVP
jgi:hydrogenase nickel incorporation protein HypA/HybF